MIQKWFRRLPSPFRRKDQVAGCRYDLSILQAEFSLTQVFDRPQTGRILFEEILRENLDLGRPDRVQLIFQRRILPKTPGSFRTRVITDGVIPSLRVQYKHSGTKQYFKQNRALRTETTINDTRDFQMRYDQKLWMRPGEKRRRTLVSRSTTTPEPPTREKDTPP